MSVVDIAAGRTATATASLRLAARCAVIGGVVAAIGMVFLVGMFAAFAAEADEPAQVLGRINDTAVLVSYLLCAPAVIAIGRLLHSQASIGSAALLVLGLGSIAVIVWFQALLIGGVMTFEEQVGYVSIGLLALGIWFIVTGWLGARAGVLPRGLLLGILGATYVGYPVWAILTARRLRDLATNEARVATAAPTTDR